MKKTILKIVLGLFSSILLIGTIFYFFLFLNPIGIYETNRLKWIPILITILSVYVSGKINKNTPLVALPLLLIPFILFKPFNYLYFPFALIILIISMLMFVITRENQSAKNRNLSWVGISCIFLYFLFNQPLIIANSGFGYDADGNMINATVLWDFSSGESLRLPSHLLLDKDTKDFNLEHLNKKTYFVTFWATWCGPCMENKPEAIKLKKQFENNSKIEFVDISFDTNPNKWKAYLDAKVPKGLQLISKNAQETSRALNFAGLPMHLIVEGNGTYRKVRSFDIAKGILLQKEDNN